MILYAILGEKIGIVKPFRKPIFDLTVGIIPLIVAVASTGWWLSGIDSQPSKNSCQGLKQFTAAIKANIEGLLSPSFPDLDSLLQSLKRVNKLVGGVNNLVNDLLFLACYDSGIYDCNSSCISLLVTRGCRKTTTLRFSHRFHNWR